jgi:hypothetical protein
LARSPPSLLTIGAPPEMHEFALTALGWAALD